MAGITAGNLLVGRVDLLAAGIARGRLFDAGDLPKPDSTHQKQPPAKVATDSPATLSGRLSDMVSAQLRVPAPMASVIMAIPPRTNFLMVKPSESLVS